MGLKWKLENPWWNHYYQAKYRCDSNDPRVKKYYNKINFYLSLEETKQLWFRDKAYLMKKPSIDRKESDKDYMFDNCQFIEHSENCIKEKRKTVIQLDLNGEFIKEWESTREIERKLGFCHSNISDACLGKSTKSNGFHWKYKGELK